MQLVKRIGIGFGRLIDWIWIIAARTVLLILTHLLYRPKIHYADKKSPRHRLAQSTVLTCNHLRGCDGAVISYVFRYSRVHSIAAEYWYKKWYLRPLFECGYTIPINHTAAWLRQSVACMEKGDSVLIFPEGRAVPGREIAPFKPGFLALASRTNAPVLPIYIAGCYNRPFLKRLHIVVGVPYTPDPPRAGETAASRTYLERESAVLFEKISSLRSLLEEKQGPRKRRSL